MFKRPRRKYLVRASPLQAVKPMPVTVLIALITASPAMLNAVAAIIEKIRAEGHPDSAPLTPAHVAEISAVVLPQPDSGQIDWDANHESA